MQRKQPYTVQRTHQARKVAYYPDIQRVYYTATLTAFIHQWAVYVLGVLIPSALTVLQFLAALHRLGKMGYIGTAVSYELLAPQIAKSTGRPCSIRTLQRGLAALRLLGFVSLRYWTIPDQTIELGNGRRVRVQGTAKKQTDTGGWKSCQIRIITLTSLAVALWDKSTKSADNPHVAKLPTPAKVAGRSKEDQVENSTKVQVSSTDRQTRTNSRQIRYKDKGRPTRPVEQAPLTLKHRASTEPKLPASKCTTISTEKEASKKEACVSVNLKSKSVPTGCSRPRLPFPHRQNTKSWVVGRTIILIELHRALSRFSGRHADSIYAQAEMEMSRSLPRDWKTAVDWDYFVPRFGAYPPAQRIRVMMSQILPILKNPIVLTPNEPRRFRQGPPGGDRQPEKLALNPFLQSLGDVPPHMELENRTRRPQKTKPENLEGMLARLANKFCGD